MILLELLEESCIRSVHRPGNPLAGTRKSTQFNGPKNIRARAG